MTIEGWSEPWPRPEVDDLGVWDRFVEQLDAAELERELMRVHGSLSDERFGSHEHRRMVRLHYRRNQDRKRPGA